jgi:hypothetical protein
MKSKTIIVLFIVLITILFVVNYFTDSVTKPPKRLANIPKQAEWVGGVDGGNWYQIKKVISKNTFNIKVYNEKTGEIEVDAVFVLNPNCPFKEIDSMLLIKSINGYDGEKILVSLPDKGRQCSLIIK